MATEITYKEVDTTIRSDATPQVKGFLYQFLIALQFCFEMEKDQTLYIEKYGDLAIRSTEEGGGLSVETKHYADKIHLLHPNVINTLYNWAQPNFHQEKCCRLFLITTQDVRESDYLNEVGKKEAGELYEGLTDKIKEEVKRIKERLAKQEESNPDTKLSKDQEKTIKQLEYLCEEAQKDTIMEIMGKWTMGAGSLDYKGLYDSIVNRYASMLENRKAQLYIDGLFAMIINPGIIEKGWCISRKDFEKRQQELNADFSAKTITFPSIGEPTDEETKGLGSSLFVEKLRMIKLEKEIAMAIHDYVKTNNLILNEIKGRPVRDAGLEKYKENLKEVFEIQHNSHTVDFTYDADQNVFKSSQKFYYAMQNACLQVKMEPFNMVDVYFAKGVLHILADDKTLDVKWMIDGTGL